MNEGRKEGRNLTNEKRKVEKVRYEPQTGLASGTVVCLRIAGVGTTPLYSPS